MKFFKPITQKIAALQRLNETKALHDLLRDKELQEYVFDLNRQNQLFDEGINSEGEALKLIGGDYSKKTKRIKSDKGQPTNRVTLKDTGEFYSSFALRNTRDGFEIVADTIKDDQDLRTRWGNEILGLTSDSTGELAFRLVPLIQDYIRKKLKI
jgi:hypothetical protein